MTQEGAFLNRLHNRVSDIVSARGGPPWMEQLILNEQVAAYLLCRAPGDLSVRGSHPDHEEFWVILAGELIWEAEGEEPIHVKAGDIVREPKGRGCNIRTVGNQPSLRLAIHVPD